NAVPSVFSNVPGSHASSLGLYLTRGVYQFRGRAGGREYTSIGLRLRGESGFFNDAAEERGIVVHGAPYVTSQGAGRSEGCPAMEPERAQRLLPLLEGGSVVFIYSPLDQRWVTQGPWVRTGVEGEG
ncbi:MAG: murein L,D-transpeptidase catalytic domain family protein, partial [Gemmatimonadota bacterium]|nr:murein L,D-transpeptidase catalytic domain family protein [Gemmatimonadota bacterium]